MADTTSNSNQDDINRVASLRQILLRHYFKRWKFKNAQERDYHAESLVLLFTSASTSNITPLPLVELIKKPITRRPGIEEVRHCLHTSLSACIPEQCLTLRGEIWQVLLNVYKQGSNTQDFDRMLMRLSKLPKDPLLVKECAQVSKLLGNIHLPVLKQSTSPFFQSMNVQEQIELLLVWFLTTKSVVYISGMAQVAAPFFLLNLSPQVVYDCFYQYCVAYVPQFMTSNDDLLLDSNETSDNIFSESNTKKSSFDISIVRSSSDLDNDINMNERQVLLEQLMCYHDPGLAMVLTQWCGNEWSICGNYIPSQFFTEMLYQILPPTSFIYVMDQYLLTNDMLFGIFLIISILTYNRDQLLTYQNSANFQSYMRQLFKKDTLTSWDDQISLLCVIASRLRSKTPRSYTCSLRQVSVNHQHYNQVNSSKSLTINKFSCCSSREAMNIAFEASPLEKESPFSVAAAQSVLTTILQSPGTGLHLVQQGNGNTNQQQENSGAIESIVPKSAVDMSEWEKRESRSFSGKTFWYHIPTGRTQWEHPAGKFEAAPSLFALPVSVEEVGRQVMGCSLNNSNANNSSIANSQHSNNGKSFPTPASSNSTGSNEDVSSQSTNIHYFIIDCRGLRSSEDIRCGRIPSAYTLDPSVLDSPELIEKCIEAFTPMKNRAHLVLVGNGVGIPPELIDSKEVKTSIRDAVRHDTDILNRAALLFQKRGFRFVSCLDGGYSSWHAFMRDQPHLSPEELLGHVNNVCHYCRYDTILKTGQDPLKKARQLLPNRRKKKVGMPTTTTMPVNGGDGDDSIGIKSTANVHTTEEGENEFDSFSSNGSSISRPSLTSITSLSRNSLTNMRGKLSDVKMSKWARRVNSMGASLRSKAVSLADNVLLDERRIDPDNGDKSESYPRSNNSSSSSLSDTNNQQDSPNANIDKESRQIELTAAQDFVAKVDKTPESEIKASPDVKKTDDFVGVFTIDYSDDEDDDEVAAEP